MSTISNARTETTLDTTSTQETEALQALQQIKLSRVLTGKYILFKHTQMRRIIAELILDFLFAHVRKPNESNPRLISLLRSRHATLLLLLC